MKLQQIQSLGLSCDRSVEIVQRMLNGLLRSTLRKVAVGFARKRPPGGSLGAFVVLWLVLRVQPQAGRGQGLTGPSCRVGISVPASGSGSSPCGFTSGMREAAASFGSCSTPPTLTEPIRGFFQTESCQAW